MGRDTAKPRMGKEIGDHELAWLIHTARRARGWTQDELGRRVGVDRDVASAWERGRRPGRHALARLVALLDLDLAASPAEQDDPVQPLGNSETSEPVQAAADASTAAESPDARTFARPDAEMGPASKFGEERLSEKHERRGVP